MKKILHQLERALRHAFVYPILRLILKNPRVESPLDITKLGKLLILRYDRIGDIIVTTPLFRALKKANPKLFVGVMASESNAELIRFNPHVDRIHTLHSSWWALWQEIRKARRTRYDVVLNLIFNRTTSGGVLANLIAPNGIKIGQGAEKYRFYFNVLLKLERGKHHMVEILASIVQEAFGVKIPQKGLRFEILVEEEIQEKVDEFLESISASKVPYSRSRQKKAKGLIVVNISATDEVRRISPIQAVTVIRSILEHCSCNIVVISAPQETQWRDGLVEEVHSARCRAYPEGRIASLREIAALIGRADAVVSPDTSIVHFASAMNTPVFGFFTPLQGMTEWLPYKVRHKTIFSSDGMPVSSIPPSVIEHDVPLFLKRIVKQ